MYNSGVKGKNNTNNGSAIMNTPVASLERAYDALKERDDYSDYADLEHSTFESYRVTCNYRSGHTEVDYFDDITDAKEWAVRMIREGCAYWIGVDGFEDNTGWWRCDRFWEVRR
jgi:hypothetical protein